MSTPTQTTLPKITSILVDAENGAFYFRRGNLTRLHPRTPRNSRLVNWYARTWHKAAGPFNGTYTLSR